MRVTKDTCICISLAKKAGNFGTTIYNHVFERDSIDFLYKAFSTNDLKASIEGARALGIRGISVTMPYKAAALDHVDELTPEVLATNATNTIVNENGKLIAYNTDTDSTRIILKEQSSRFDTLHILGDGGFSKAVQYSASGLFSNVQIITRKNWEILPTIDEGLIFNCTPVKNLHQKFAEKDGVGFIDADVTTQTGKRMAVLQAARQFELYTGCNFPTHYVLQNLEKIMGK